MGMEVSICLKKDRFHMDIEFQTQSKRIGILGASGCGKSMTLKTIAGIEYPQRERIVVQENCFSNTDKKIHLPPQKRQIGYLFQNYALFPNMTVEQNICIGIKERKKAEQEQRVHEMLRMFRLLGYEKKYPSELSGGQQQRVALARIMAYHPKLILLDEPFSALDSYLKESLKQEMKDFLECYDGTMILVSHSREEIYALCDWLIVMEHGKIVETGNTKEVFQKPNHTVTAKLTGCKNISAIKRIDAHTCHSLAWNTTFTVDMQIKETAKFMGFRAHDLKITTKALPGMNCFPAKVFACLEEPFEWIYYLAPLSSQEETGELSQKMCLKVHKEQNFTHLKEKDTIFVSVSPEAIFIMEE